MSESTLPRRTRRWSERTESAIGPCTITTRPPAPAVRPRGVAPLPLRRPGIGGEVIAELRAADMPRPNLRQTGKSLTLASAQLAVAESAVSWATTTRAGLDLQHIAVTNRIGDLSKWTANTVGTVFADFDDALASYELGGIDTWAEMILLKTDLAELDQAYAAALTETAADLAELFAATEIGGVSL